MKKNMCQTCLLMRSSPEFKYCDKIGQVLHKISEIVTTFALSRPFLLSVAINSVNTLQYDQLDLETLLFVKKFKMMYKCAEV